MGDVARTRAAEIEEEQYLRATADVSRMWRVHQRGVCRDCTEGAARPSGGVDLNVDGRCFFCAVTFLVKLRSIAVIAEPWALRQARKDGFANQ